MCKSEYAKQWRKKNRQHINNYMKKWVKQNYVKHYGYVKNWQENNVDKWKESSKSWRDKNIDRLRASSRICQQNRRAIIRNSKGTIIKDDWFELLVIAECRCQCCGSEENLELDHVIPLSCGGEHSKENAQVLCKSCNASKGNRRFTDYR